MVWQDQMTSANDALFKGLSTGLKKKTCLWQGKWLIIMAVKRRLTITVCKCLNINEQCHEKATGMGNFMNGSKYYYLTLTLILLNWKI
jgi:hypothetical protein